MSEAFLHMGRWFEAREHGACMQCVAHNSDYPCELSELCMSLPSCEGGTVSDHRYYVEVAATSPVATIEAIERKVINMELNDSSRLLVVNADEYKQAVKKFLEATATNGYDPIAEAEYEGRQAFIDGFTLREAIDEFSVEIDTDSGEAFIAAFKQEQQRRTHL